MVEVRDDITAQWTKTVFIDDAQLRLQLPEDPIIHDGYVAVRILTGGVSNCPDPNTIPYQVKPFTQEIGEGREITTLYLKYP